jgi:aminodeoxyfutalosine synthase
MISEIVKSSAISSRIKDIALKVLDATRISPEEGILLYKEADTSLLALLADQVRKRIVGEYVYYNRNVHIEPTNICVYDCKFCSYSHHQSKESWELSVDEMVKTVASFVRLGVPVKKVPD